MHIVISSIEPIWFSFFNVRIHYIGFLIRNAVHIILIRRLRRINTVNYFQPFSVFIVTVFTQMDLLISAGICRCAIDLIFLAQIKDFNNARKERVLSPIDICCHNPVVSEVIKITDRFTSVKYGITHIIEIHFRLFPLVEPSARIIFYRIKIRDILDQIDIVCIINILALFDVPLIFSWKSKPGSITYSNVLTIDSYFRSRIVVKLQPGNLFF